MYKKFKLCQCPHCGSISIISAMRIFKCRSCGKSRVLYSKVSRIGENVKILCSSDLWEVVHGVLKSIRKGDLQFLSYRVRKE